MKDIQVLVGVDVDAVAGWLGSYGGGDSPSDIQRGMFAGEVGSPRLLTLLGRQEISSTWFIPGHSLETFPEQMAAVADAGHEIGAHGYAHENPIALTGQQERDVMARSVELITKMCGRAPRGYVAPWWETSERGALLLAEFGFSYGHSQNYHDFLPFYARVGDKWTKPDYTQPAATWMRPLERGAEMDIVEFCGNWYMDDLPPMMFIKQSPNSHGFVNPRDIEQLWPPKPGTRWSPRRMSCGTRCATPSGSMPPRARSRRHPAARAGGRDQPGDPGRAAGGGADALLMPVAPSGPTGVGARASRTGRRLDDAAQMAHCRAVSLTGLPALSMPAGPAPAGSRTAGGRLSVQLVGADHGENRLCEVAADLTASRGLGASRAPA